MVEFLFSLGYLGLFIVSFLGATLLPLSTELFVLGMPTLGYKRLARDYRCHLGRLRGEHS